MAQSIVVLLDNSEGQAMVKETCRENGILFAELQELVQVEVEQAGKQRRAGMWDSFDDILDRIATDDKQ